jgi:uncharacterized protein YutD
VTVSSTPYSASARLQGLYHERARLIVEDGRLTDMQNYLAEYQQPA